MMSGKVVFTWFGLINPQLLLGTAFCASYGLLLLLKTENHIRWLKSLPRSMHWAWGAWMPDAELRVATRIGGAMFILFS